MTTYTFVCYDWNDHTVEITLTAATYGEALRAARDICEASRQHINIDDGLYLHDERPYC